MPFVIAEPCIGVKDKSCVEVCPVNCIYEGEDQFLHSSRRVHRLPGVRSRVPVQAIFPDNGVPEKWAGFTAKEQGVLPEVTQAECPARDEALALLQEWVESPALRRHCRCVECAMRAYARKFGEDEARWGWRA